VRVSIQLRPSDLSCATHVHLQQQQQQLQPQHTPARTSAEEEVSYTCSLLQLSVFTYYKQHCLHWQHTGLFITAANWSLHYALCHTVSMSYLPVTARAVQTCGVMMQVC
jgi:hypothetical protein